MRIPFWIPSLWIAGFLLAWPGHIWLTILGYHAICLMGSLQTDVWRVGHPDRTSWFLIALGIPILVAPWLIPPFSTFPKLQVISLLSQWPGGLGGHAIYALLVNAPVEEAYWRGSIARQHPDWSPLQQGAAFGLHHAIAAAILFPWGWAILAFFGSAIMGALWAWLAKKTQGIAIPILGHAMADLGLIFLAAHQLS